MADSQTEGRCLTVKDVVGLFSFRQTHGSCFSFSSDATRLAFCAQRPLAYASYYTDMFLAGIARSVPYAVKLETRTSCKVAAEEDCFAPTWSPCGDHFAFGAATADVIQLAVMGMRTRER